MDGSTYLRDGVGGFLVRHYTKRYDSLHDLEGSEDIPFVRNIYKSLKKRGRAFARPVIVSGKLI